MVIQGQRRGRMTPGSLALVEYSSLKYLWILIHSTKPGEDTVQCDARWICGHGCISQRFLWESSGLTTFAIVKQIYLRDPITNSCNHRNSCKFPPKKGNLKETNNSKKSSSILRAHLVNCVTSEDRAHCCLGTLKEQEVPGSPKASKFTWSRSPLFLPASLPVIWDIYS